jgi:hypothetical protein
MVNVVSTPVSFNLGAARLNRRAPALLEAMVEKKTLVINQLPVSWMVLHTALKSSREIKIEYTFTSGEVECLEHLGPSLEGTTSKQRNPYRLKTLRWAAWIIARLAGWTGYAS